MASEGIDAHLGQVGDDGEAAAHVAIEGAVADGDLALVARGEEERAELVGHGHEEEAAGAGLDVFLGHVDGETFKEIAEGGLGGGDGVGDGDFVVFDAEIFGERGGVVAAVLAGDGGGQGDADHVVGAEGFGGERGDHGGVDATAEADERFLKAALVCVVAEPEHEGVVGGGVAFEIKMLGDVASGIVEVDDMVLFAEGGEAGDEAAVWMGGDAAAIEDELVVATNGVAIHGGASAALGGVLHERLASFVLTFVPRAGREVEQEVDLLLGEHANRIVAIAAAGGHDGVVPNVLADGETDFEAVPFVDSGGFGGLEVAFFVEDVVARKEALATDGLDLAGFAPSGGVVEGAAGQVGAAVLHEADHGRHRADFFGDGFERVLCVADEAGLKE